MPRPQRLPPIPFGWYYIALSARDGRSLFRNATDVKMLLKLLSATLARKGAHLHAGCVTPSEVHLAILTGEAPVSAITRSFCHDYANRFNRNHRESGRLFRAHPHVLLIQHHLWLVPLVHVIHWIPRLRQSRCGACEKYWSSDAAYRGRARREGCFTWYPAALDVVTYNRTRIASGLITRRTLKILGCFQTDRRTTPACWATRSSWRRPG